MMWLYKQKAVLEKRFFPERARMWRRWKQHDASCDLRADHTAWADLLQRHVRRARDGSTRIAYGEITAADRRQLEDYLLRCAATPISGYRRGEQLAFWANVYNAATVRLVLKHYPLRSIKNIGCLPTWLGGGPWNEKVIAVEGVELTLNDIEHRILRRNWRDPRIHYAVNCGSIGCPDLRSLPFSGPNIEAELDDAARQFINHPRGARVDGQRLVVCSIFVWFKEDFGGSDVGVIEHLRHYAAADLASGLGLVQRINAHEYDWRLNDVGQKRGE
jgi:hypothetical protein